MPYEVYKLLHFLGILMTFLSLGGVILFVMNGGTKEQLSHRKLAGIMHGIGLVLILLGGFGMLAKINLQGRFGWLVLKILIWIALGGISGLAYNKPDAAKSLWFGVIILGLLAVALVVFKPL
jgi:uncharacterized membrane protein SirB2